MKKIIVPFFVCFLLASFSSFGQSENDGNKTMQDKPTQEQRDLSKEDNVDKTEIPANSLPLEAQREIKDTYHNAEILQAYILNYGEDRKGYLVEVKQGPKKWTIEFDEDGNPKNKILPIKM